MLRSDFLTRRHVGLLRLFLLLPLTEALYDTISSWFSCTIRSRLGFLVRYDLVLLLLYDINLGATTTTILSTRGVTIPIDLVSSATDSI